MYSYPLSSFITQEDKKRLANIISSFKTQPTEPAFNDEDILNLRKTAVIYMYNSGSDISNEDYNVLTKILSDETEHKIIREAAKERLQKLLAKYRTIPDIAATIDYSAGEVSAEGVVLPIEQAGMKIPEATISVSAVEPEKATESTPVVETPTTQVYNVDAKHTPTPRRIEKVGEENRFTRVLGEKTEKSKEEIDR